MQLFWPISNLALFNTLKYTRYVLNIFTLCYTFFIITKTFIVTVCWIANTIKMMIKLTSCQTFFDFDSVNFNDLRNSTLLNTNIPNGFNLKIARITLGNTIIWNFDKFVTRLHALLSILRNISIRRCAIMLTIIQRIFNIIKITIFHRNAKLRGFIYIIITRTRIDTLFIVNIIGTGHNTQLFITTLDNVIIITNINTSTIW